MEPDLPGNFINPAYATPEQIMQLRAMAAQLQSGAVAPDTSKHWTGALAQALMGMRGQGMVNNANQLQRQLLQQGQQGMQQAGQANPMANMIMGGQNPTSPQASNAAPSGGNVPRGIRNNNPGNIEDGPFAKSMPGYAGGDGRFAIFNSPEAGAKAMDSLLSTYGNKGINTAAGVINRWAPPGENNSTAYASTVAKQLGTDPNAPLNMSDPAIRQQLGAAITGYENGPRYAPQRQQTAQNGGDLSAFYMNPSIPAEIKDAVRKGNTPVGVEDVTGRQGYTTTMGGPRLAPQGPGFTQGYRGNVTLGPDGGISAPTAFPAPNSGAPSMRDQVGNLYQTGQDFARQSSANKAEREALGGDITTAAANPQVRQILTTMKQDIQSHGDKMVFGPTSDWINNLKRSIAQHAPGLMTATDLAGLASADSFDKLSAQLQSIVGRQVGGTDASLLQGMRSVPGQHNSKEGALALIDMLDQVAQQQTKFAVDNHNKFVEPGFNYIAAKTKFFEDNPIKNPLTKNTLRDDLGKSNNQGGQSKTLNGKTYQKLNGVWHEVL